MTQGMVKIVFLTVVFLLPGALAGSITGTVFEDVNYGGGAGRTLAASSGVGRPDVRVELYSSTGTFLRSETTNASGVYTFGDSTPATDTSLPGAPTVYIVRVVNNTVASSRTGACTTPVDTTTCTQLAVQTFRAEAPSANSTGTVTATAVTDRVGGEDPSKVDAAANTTSATLASLTTTTTTAQSISSARLRSNTSIVNGVNFGFNFDTVVSTRDSGQGSLRQFILNSNALTGNASLAQSGSTTNTRATTSALPAGKESSIFMIANGTTRPGLRNTVASQLTSGVAVIALSSSATTTSTLPIITDSDTIIDGGTQTYNIADSNTLALNTASTVGIDALAVPAIAGPEVQLQPTAGLYATASSGLRVTGANTTVQNLAILGFTSSTTNSTDDANIYIATGATGAMIRWNVVGTTARSYTDPGATTRTTDYGILARVNSVTVRENLVAYSGAGGIELYESGASTLVEANELRSNAITNVNAENLNINTTATTGAIIRGNLSVNAGGPGFDTSGATSGGNTFENNTVTGNGILTTGQTPGLRILGPNNIIRRNIIGQNYGAGILVRSDTTNTGNLITRNSIYANGTTGTTPTKQIGIDLNTDNTTVGNAAGTSPFVTINDANDSDTGPNNLINFPILESVLISGSNLVLTGCAPAGATIELFEADVSPGKSSTSGANTNSPRTLDYGEGETYLTTLTEGVSDTDAGTGCAATDGNTQTGMARFVFSIATPTGVVSGDILTATATVSNSTSEFSSVLSVTARDFGDAPASYSDASHTIAGTPTVYLGSVVPDAETVSLNAANGGADGTGDDTTTGDDEGGVTFPRLTAGQAGTFSIVVAGAGFLSSWLDWNGDGDFGDGGEQIITNIQDNGAGDTNATTGTIGVSVTAPATMTTNPTYARFRWSSTSGLTSSGTATDGEVEDYLIPITNLAINKTGTSSVTVNGSVSYNITVTNTGSNVTGVSITDTVPAYITVSSWTCTATGTADCNTSAGGTDANGTTNTIALNNVQINTGAGNSLTINVTGIATTPGSITNTARVSPPAGTLDTVGTNNTSSQATTINALTVTPPTLTNPGATPICAVPGSGGDGSLSGVINTYYGSASTNQTVAAGSTSVNLEASRGAGTPISTGDLILFIQMQDATINTSNTRNYGGNNGSGTSYTSLGNTGFYEYVVATNNVPLTGGTLTFRGAGAGNGLVNAFTNADPSSTRGQRTFQIIRVPQYANATISGTLQAVKWNGKSGGVVVVDVAGTLTWSAGSTIDVELSGFRAGYAPAANSGSSSGTLYRCSVKTDCGAGKGEGVAGTPANLWDGSAAITTGSGYPDGTNSDADYGMGAPANGGGGGGFHNAGGGGGSNGGAGGKGGLGWEGQSTTNDGGEPGVPLPPAINRLFMGGGGGGGDANNAITGVRGGVGAGIVIVRAGRMTGTGTIEADGDNGDRGVYQSAPDGAGGGGAGGSVLLYAKNSSSATITVNARGGPGGNTENDNNNEHGPGGGGGGGLVVYSVPGGTVNTVLTGGLAGRANNGAGITHGAQDGTPGHALTFTTTNDPFANGGDGSTCAPQLSVAKTTSTPTRSSSDTTATYSISVTNAAGKGTGRGLAITDDLPSPFTYAGAAVTPVYAGGASGPASITGAGTDPVVFGTAGGNDTNSFTLPAGGSVTLTFTVNLNSAPGATYQNPATVAYSDPTSATATVSPGGTDTLGQSVPGSNYASGSSTNEDVTIAGIILGIAKALDRIVHSNSATDNLYTLVYRLTLENFGSVTLSNSEIYDDVVTQFSGLSPTNFNTWVSTPANAALLSPAPTLTLNGSWNGAASSNVLAASQTLTAGQSKLVYISFSVTVNPAAASPNNQLRDNSAMAQGTNPSSVVMSDTSTKGTDPDGADNDNNPDENTVTDAPFVKLVKEVRNCGSSLASCSGAYGTSATGKPGDYLEYRIRYYNISSQAISQLRVSDTLATTTPFQEETYAVISPNVADFNVTCPNASTVDLDRSNAAITTTPAAGAITAFNMNIMAATACNLTQVTPGQQGQVLFKVKIP